MSLLAREVVSSNVVNDQDQGALATIAAALALTTIGILFCIRLLIRWPWRSLFGSDDAAVAIASVRSFVFPLHARRSDISQVFGMVYSIVVLMEVPTGLGRKSASLTPEDSLSVQKVCISLACGLHICSRWTDGLCQRHLIRLDTLLEQARRLFPSQTALYRASTREAGRHVDLHLRWAGFCVIARDRHS